MPSSSKPRSGFKLKFKSRFGLKFKSKLKRQKSKFKNRKAQFFILSALVIVGMLYFISRWSDPYSIIDTSAVASSEETFVFNNIVAKAEEVVKSTGNSSEELRYNLEEYKYFVEDYCLGRNMHLDFDISHVSFGNPVTGFIDVTLSSSSRTISRRIDVSRSFP